MSPHVLVFEKACHLPLELEHQAMWACQKLNFNHNVVGEVRLLQLHELQEWRSQAYKKAKLYEEKMRA